MLKRKTGLVALPDDGATAAGDPLVGHHPGRVVGVGLGAGNPDPRCERLAAAEVRRGDTFEPVVRIAARIVVVVLVLPDVLVVVDPREGPADAVADVDTGRQHEGAVEVGIDSVLAEAGRDFAVVREAEAQRLTGLQRAGWPDNPEAGTVVDRAGSLAEAPLHVFPKAQRHREVIDRHALVVDEHVAALDGEEAVFWLDLDVEVGMLNVRREGTSPCRHVSAPVVLLNFVNDIALEAVADQDVEGNPRKQREGDQGQQRYPRAQQGTRAQPVQDAHAVELLTTEKAYRQADEEGGEAEQHQPGSAGARRGRVPASPCRSTRACSRPSS